MANVTNTQVNVKPHVQAMSTITGLNDKIAEIESAISGADGDIEALDGRLDTAESDIDALETAVADRYTKAETDSAIASAVASVYKYKGSVEDYAHLPSSGQIVGDVYNVEDTGDNYAWDGTDWDKLAGTVDLSGYYTKTNINTMSGLNGATATFSAVDVSAADASTKQVSITDQTDNQSIDGAFDKDAASIKNLANAYNALETRVDSDETDIGNRYTKTEINTITGLNSASAGFTSTALSVDSSTKQMSATDTTDSRSIDAAQDANVTAFKAIKDAYNALETRVDSLESGDDERTKFYEITFSGTEHTYSDSFITADSFVNYNFASDPVGYVEFTVQAGKIGVKSSATESSLVIKVSVTKNPGTFTTLTADA